MLKKTRLIVSACFAISLASAWATPITLLDLCKPYRKDSFNNGVKVTQMTQNPIVFEKTQTVVWTRERATENGEKTKGQVLWRTREGSVIGLDLKVKNQFYALYLNSPRRLIERAHVRSKEDAQKIVEGMSTLSKSEFDEQFKLRLIQFAQHLGYPIEGTENFEKFAEFKPAKVGERIVFAGRNFDVGEGETLILISPKEEEQLKEIVPFLFRLQGGDSNFVFKEHDNFETTTVLRCDFMTEEGLAIEAGQTITTKADGTKIYQEGVERKLAFHAIGGRVQVGAPSLLSRVQSVFVAPDDQSNLAVLEHCEGLRPGDLIHSINGHRARNREELEHALGVPTENLGEPFKVLVMTPNSEGSFFSGVYNFHRKEFEIKPDAKALKEQKELLAETERIKEEARQSVITLHEKERAQIEKDLIEFRKEAEIETLKSRDGILALVREKVQPMVRKTVTEFAREDPFWGLNYLKYLQSMQAEMLTPLQLKKLNGIVWLEQDTRFDSQMYLDVNFPGTAQAAIDLGISLTGANTKPTKITLLKGEMLFQNHDLFLPVDHPQKLLDFLLDEERQELTPLETFTISDSGAAQVDIFHYFDEDKEKFVRLNELKTIAQKPTLAAYQEIVTSERNYTDNAPPRAKKRTLTELAAKTWLVTTVGVNTLLLGAEALGIDTNEVLKDAQNLDNLAPSKNAETESVKIGGSQLIKSNWSGKAKAIEHEFKLSNGTKYKLKKVLPNSGSIRAGRPGWHVSEESAMRLGLDNSRCFGTSEQAQAYVLKNKKK